MGPQLLCTFAHRNDLNIIIDYISSSYILTENRLFVFNNIDAPSDLYITFNIENNQPNRINNTISIHRKKETNTLYTVNALNRIVKDANNGILDHQFIIDWYQYKNSLLLTDDDMLKHIKLRLFSKITI